MYNYNPFTLEGKCVLVTGASSGIGKCAAIECSKLGANLVLTARNEKRLDETLGELRGINHFLEVADLTKDEDVKDLIESLPDLDGVVLCAGVGATIPIKNATTKRVHELFEINFFSQVELLRLLIKHKKMNRNASVVAISSIGGPLTSEMGNAPYGASKSALQTWMKIAALEFASRGIRVNCICPGMVHTPLVDERQVFSEEEMAAYINNIPLKHLGDPEDIANGIIYLLSDASKWVTGTQLIIDGGTTLK